MKNLVLPWPDKDLSPNGRVHWARKAKASASARELSKVEAMASGWAAGHTLPEGRLHLWIDFYPPTRRMPDDDNMLARCKPYRDGIADALGIDDKRFVSHPYVRETPRKGGQVVFRITGGAAANEGV